MKIYKDVFSGDELFSDTYKISLTKDCLYEVVGKYETRREGEVQLAGANASAEEAAEDSEVATETGIDIVLNHRLQETGFGSKKEFTVYLKDYMKRVIKYLNENGKEAQVDDFKKNIQAVMSELISKFKDLMFFTGESMDGDAMICMAIDKEVNGEEKPVMLFYKHGLEEEKF